mmetsp:Transcript_1894/g.3425  ORF Transcript_1894/g.3425 Transcript_1894/m.3425 type:complete len:423 (+) Transcript_1894:761-2029(+)
MAPKIRKNSVNMTEARDVPLTKPKIENASIVSLDNAQGGLPYSDSQSVRSASRSVVSTAASSGDANEYESVASRGDVAADHYRYFRGPERERESVHDSRQSPLSMSQLSKKRFEKSSTERAKHHRKRRPKTHWRRKAGHNPENKRHLPPSRFPVRPDVEHSSYPAEEYKDSSYDHHPPYIPSSAGPYAPQQHPITGHYPRGEAQYFHAWPPVARTNTNAVPVGFQSPHALHRQRNPNIHNQRPHVKGDVGPTVVTFGEASSRPATAATVLKFDPGASYPPNFYTRNPPPTSPLARSAQQLPDFSAADQQRSPHQIIHNHYHGNVSQRNVVADQAERPKSATALPAATGAKAAVDERRLSEHENHLQQENSKTQRTTSRHNGNRDQRASADERKSSGDAALKSPKGLTYRITHSVVNISRMCT